MPKFLHVGDGTSRMSRTPVGCNTAEWAGLAATQFPGRPYRSGVAD